MEQRVRRDAGVKHLRVSVHVRWVLPFPYSPVRGPCAVRLKGLLRASTRALFCMQLYLSVGSCEVPTATANDNHPSSAGESCHVQLVASRVQQEVLHVDRKSWAVENLPWDGRAARGETLCAQPSAALPLPPVFEWVRGLFMPMLQIICTGAGSRGSFGRLRRRRRPIHRIRLHLILVLPGSAQKVGSEWRSGALGPFLSLGEGLVAL